MFKVDFDSLFGEEVCVHEEGGKVNAGKRKL